MLTIYTGIKERLVIALDAKFHKNKIIQINDNIFQTISPLSRVRSKYIEFVINLPYLNAKYLKMNIGKLTIALLVIVEGNTGCLRCVLLTCQLEKRKGTDVTNGRHPLFSFPIGFRTQ